MTWIGSIPPLSERLIKRVAQDRECPLCSGVVPKGSPAICTRHSISSPYGEGALWEHPGCWDRRLALERAEGSGPELRRARRRNY